MKKAFKSIAIALCLVVLGQFIAIPYAAAATLISTKQEISMGKKVAEDLEKKFGLVEDELINERVKKIGSQVANFSERKELEFSFKVLNSTDINALAVPGGYIYVFKGLVDTMKTDEQLAGVIGHEVGHVSKRHSIRQMEKSLGANLLMAVLFGSNAAPIQDLLFNIVMASYSRDDEREADFLGFSYATKAGYTPYSMQMGLEKLNELNDKTSYTIFNTHPPTERRIELVKGYTEKQNVPKVVEEAGSIYIVDDKLKQVMPNVSYGDYSPKHRAYILAGALYKLKAVGTQINVDNFIPVRSNDGVDIYYDDIYCSTITYQDAQNKEVDINELVTEYLTFLRAWAEKQKVA